MTAEPLNSPTTVYTMSESVPIFLKKTYHMIDSCDAEIAGWDEDGLTFTVKDPNLFETKIIPQFFKHSKFSSFVRQLNFYSFRKIKYGDSIRIDIETEKRTANYWRFKHEHFRQGRPDLLSDIKRMNGKNSSSADATAATATTTASVSPGGTPNAVPSAVLSAPVDVVPSSVLSSSTGTNVPLAEKSEVLKLKKRIDEMTKNIDKLTEMVNKVTLQKETNDFNDQTVIEPGSKRKKTPQQSKLIQDDTENTPMVIADLPMPDEAYSTSLMDMDEFMPSSLSQESTPPTLSLPLPQPMAALSRESSSTDSDFVDQLFTAFHEDDDVVDWFASQHNKTNDIDELDEFLVSHTSNNRPDPELMQRLSDALQYLPRDIQEMIVNRLIEAITSIDGFNFTPPTPFPSSSSAAPTITTTLQQQVVTPLSTKTVVSEPTKKHITGPKMSSTGGEPIQPLAAATLAALLHHYSNQIKGSQQHKQQQQQMMMMRMHHLKVKRISKQYQLFQYMPRERENNKKKLERKAKEKNKQQQKITDKHWSSFYKDGHR